MSIETCEMSVKALISTAKAYDSKHADDLIDVYEGSDMSEIELIQGL